MALHSSKSAKSSLNDRAIQWHRGAGASPNVRKAKAAAKMRAWREKKRAEGFCRDCGIRTVEKGLNYCALCLQAGAERSKASQHRKRNLKKKNPNKKKTAGEIGYDETGESFERTFKKLAPPTQKKRNLAELRTAVDRFNMILPFEACPKCEVCGFRMRIRLRKVGDDPYWGCGTYLRCAFTKPIDRVKLEAAFDALNKAAFGKPKPKK
jgi:hypothetical protein